MSLTSALLAAIAAGLVVAIVLLALLVARRPAEARETREGFGALVDAQRDAAERLQREVRAEVLEQARGNRVELAESIGRFARQVTAQASSVAQIQNAQIDGFAQQLVRLTESNERRLTEIRATLETKLRELQADNAGRL